MVNTVYILKSKKQKIYVGVTNKQIGVNYFTSSKIVNPVWEKNPSSFEVINKFYFKDRSEAQDYEARLITLYKKVIGSECLNQVAYPKWFITSEELSRMNKGRKHTLETRKKLSEAQKGRKHSLETRNKIKKANSGENNYFFGKKHSEEYKKKMSERTKGRGFTKEHRENLSKAGKGRKQSLEHRRKNSEAHKGSNNSNFGKKYSLQRRKIHSEAITKWWKKRKEKICKM